jgi:hypothetical protein
VATSESFHDYLLERIKNTVEAEVYLETACEEYSEDRNMEMFWTAQKNIIEAGNEEIIVKHIDLISALIKKETLRKKKRPSYL